MILTYVFLSVPLVVMSVIDFGMCHNFIKFNQNMTGIMIVKD